MNMNAKFLTKYPQTKFKITFGTVYIMNNLIVTPVV